MGLVCWKLGQGFARPVIAEIQKIKWLVGGFFGTYRCHFHFLRNLNVVKLKISRMSNRQSLLILLPREIGFRCLSQKKVSYLNAVRRRIHVQLLSLIKEKLQLLSTYNNSASRRFCYPVNPKRLVPPPRSPSPSSCHRRVPVLL